MANLRRWPVLLGLAVFASMAAGCGGTSGPKLYPVHGKVLHKGKPAVKAVVFFHRKDRTSPTEPVPHGEADGEGRFSLTSHTMDDGALAGEYVVTVVWPDPDAKPGRDGERPDLLQGAYVDLKKSLLKAEVKAGANDLPPFELK